MKTLVSLYTQYLNNREQFAVELQSKLRGGKLSAADAEALANAHCAWYDERTDKKGNPVPCRMVRNERGSFRFYICEEVSTANKHGAAQKAWDRTVAQYVRTTEARGGARNKAEPMSEVDKLVATYSKLSAADAKKFRKLVGW